MTVGRASDVGALLVAGLVALVGALVLGVLPGVVLASGLALGVSHGGRRAPVWLATMRRTRALGAAPALVARTALRLRLEPSTERAARFASRTGEGVLARSLEDHTTRAVGTPDSGLESFAADWQPWFPALVRAASLLESAARAPPAERERGLTRALECVLESVSDRMASFTGEVRGPVAGAYAFGVVLPLAVAGLLPAASVAGFDVSPVHVVVIYDLLLPGALVVAAGWILLHRPVAFAPPAIARSNSAVPDRHWRPVVAGVAAGLLAGVATWVVLAPWAGAIAATGVGLGSGLWLYARPRLVVRDRVRAIEEGLEDAMFLVGRRVGDGASVETAIDTVGAELPGETGRLLADAAERQRRLGVGVHGSFLGEYGVLSGVPSHRAREAASFLALAASEGRPAGEALVSLGEHLGGLRRIEREGRRELATVTETLRNTAAVFGPLVAGATVALAARMGRTPGVERGSVAAGPGGGATLVPGSPGSVASTTLGTEALGVAVGGYALILAVAVTTLAVGLERGMDPTLVAHRVGLALPAATATFLAAYVGVAVLV